MAEYPDSTPPLQVLLRGLAFEHLATFKAVVEGGSFRRAAEKQLISQPAVSQRIRQLEALLGVPVFDRRRGTGAQLTSSGELLLALAERVLTELECFYADLHALAVPAREDSVVVASGPSFIKYCLLAVARRFSERYPEVEVLLRRSMSPDDVLEEVLEHTADLGIYSGPVPTRKVRSFPLGHDLLLLVAPRNHRITQLAGPARVAELSRTPFALSCEPAHSRQLTEAWARHSDVNLRVKIEVDNLDTLKEAVLQGVALAILPEFAIREELDASTLVPIALPGLPLERRVSVIADTARPLSAAQRAFVDVLARAMRASERPASGSHARTPALQTAVSDAAAPNRSAS